MSNKLAKHQELKELLTVKQRKVLFWGLLSVMVIAFIAVWANIAVTSHAFNKQMEDMILGEDYFIEDIVITDKRIESGVSDDDISQNYFSIIMMEKYTNIVNICRFRQVYTRSMT